MSHDEIQKLIHSYADRELDPAETRMVKDHLETCESCRSLDQQVRNLRRVVKAAAPQFKAPQALQKNIRTAVRQEKKTTEQRSWPWMPSLVAATCALVLGGFVLFQNYRFSRDRIVDDAIASHVRSLLASHLIDVGSTDQHTVKPWFNGKIDYAPPVQDLSANGFPLVGGRLDYFNGKTVAALVYKRNQHPINVLITPESGKRDSSPSALTRRGYNVVHWTRNEMDYWAVSDLNSQELQQFAQLFQ